MQDFTQLRVWKDAHQIALDICLTIRQFPAEELEVLAAEIYESAMAIPVSISQGAGLFDRAEFADAVTTALGKCARLECCLILAKDLGYLPPVEFECFAGRLSKLRRQLGALRKSLLTPKREVISLRA